MGWLFTAGQTRSDLIRERTKSWTNEKEGLSATCLEHCAVGNILWTVWEHRRRDGPVDRFIGCDILACERGYGWGYKDLCESMGPGYYTCPLKYLERVPEPPGSYAKPWRAKVREYHAKCSRINRLKVGEIVRLEHCKVPEVTIVSVRPLIGECAGRRYRIPRKVLA